MLTKISIAIFHEMLFSSGAKPAFGSFGEVLLVGETAFEVELLLEEEEEKYVDYRFNRTLVRRITGLERPALDLFMKMYRPTYDYVRSVENDYEFYKYIKDCGTYFMKTYKADTPPKTP